jgi:hypothetical protein
LLGVPTLTRLSQLPRSGYGPFVDCSETEDTHPLNTAYGIVAQALSAKRNKHYGATVSDISSVRAVRFCGSAFRRYNVWSDVCCWGVIAIQDYHADMPDPITREPTKGESFCLTCWQVLK